MATRTLVLVGTKSGAFILESDAQRANWQLRGPFCEAWPIYHLQYDAESETLYAAGGNAWFGPAVWRSADLGRTWTQSGAGLTYGDEGPAVTKIWHVEAAHGALYAGADPAGLFRSEDQGATWSHVAGLRRHPTNPEWNPGAGGLCLHSIVPHPTDPAQMWVAISAVGTFYTADGGETWQTRNAGVRQEFGPERFPEFGQCVHKLLLAADGQQLYQQNHCGVYRSADGGAQWDEISAGLPSDFGFPLALHPRDPNTLYVIPLVGMGRYVPDAHMVVWRSRDRGATWTALTSGLPEKDAYIGVLREAMAVDTRDQAGIYFGTTGGQLYGSANEGDDWQVLAGNLPTIWSVETAIVED